ncbi:MAG TPA: tRNA lysidine(34) synthetase TilS [Propionibacteriaceae bacterium]|nr:tRNA lysidine(34) synthetase TilS [Propionibacteriaceae bacterium]
MARRELGPASLAVAQAVEDTWATASVESGGRLPPAVLVACSGGADSLALAFAAERLASRHELGLSAVVIDHGLQEASASVAGSAVFELERLGYSDAVVLRVSVEPEDGRGVEAAARQARYAALDAEAARRRAIVLLGHTLDDQAETVLLGLARGSGTRSLAGMRPRTAGYLRPLLRLRRAVTVQACQELGLTYWLDPHNSDPAYTRSRVRHRVLPVLEAELGPGVAAALARTAELARDDADLLDQLAEQAHPEAETADCSTLAGLPAALRRRALRRWLVRHGVPEPSYRAVVDVEALVTDWRGQRGIHVPGGTVVRTGGRLHLNRR